MKKWFFIFLSLPLLFSSCSKSDKCGYAESGASATTAEITYLQNYLATNSIIASQHTSGIFYAIVDPGAGSVATVCSNITVNYSGVLLSNGHEFDSDNSAAGVSFVLGQLIVGWQKGLPIIRKGGTIVLYIPPSLGYKSTDRLDQYGAVVIPANSYLKFTIHLLDVQ